MERISPSVGFNCGAKYLKSNEEKVKRIEAADYLSTELVDAKSAYYLIGSDVPPVMSYVSTIVFSSKQRAETFQESHGGKIVTFEEALAKQQ